MAVKHPLSPEDYIDYIRQAGVGLFLYDSRRYFARCSGVLVEMLASGVPVIVPAGAERQLVLPIGLPAGSPAAILTVEFEQKGRGWLHHLGLRRISLPARAGAIEALKTHFS